METGSANSIGGTQAGPPLVPPPKRPHLDPGEGGIWPYATNKPVGIAQPFQKKESVEVDPVDSLKKEDKLSEEEVDLKAGLSLDFRAKPDFPAKDASAKDVFVFGVDKTREFSGKRHSSTESDTDSDSSSSFSSQFGPLLESIDNAALGGEDIGGDGGEHCGVQGEHSGGKREHEEGSGEKEAAGATRMSGGHKKDSVDLQASASITAAPSPPPGGRRYHLFVSHSTSDQEWARSRVVFRLSGVWKVKACYQLMPDQSRYDNAGIKDCMRQSCVVLLGLSPAYLRSERCIKEWQFAVELSSRSVTVVVGVVSSCSRPEPLKQFLYLDFMDRERKKAAWDKLLETIGEKIERLRSSTQAKTGIQQPPPRQLKRLPAPSPSHTSAQSSRHSHPSHFSSHPSAQSPGHSIHHPKAPHPTTEPPTLPQTRLSTDSSHLATQSSSPSTADPSDPPPGSQSLHSSNSFDSSHLSSHPPHLPRDPSHLPTLSPRSSHSSTHSAELLSSQQQSSFDFHDSGDVVDFNSQDEAEQMMAGFEAMLSEVGGVFKGDSPSYDKPGLQERGAMLNEVGGAFKGDSPSYNQPGVQAGEEAEDSSDNESSHEPSGSLTESHDQTVESHDASGDREEAKGEKRSGSGDVEEGEVSDSSEEVSKSSPQEASEVASFYNNLARPDADRRNESPIKLMRNFNNWVKSVLIRSYLRHCPHGCTALDICCGKGGDLLKWKEGRIEHLVCADISSESIAAAKDRYHSDKMMGKGRRAPFSADFYVADCTKERLSDLAGAPLFFHIASCQFSIHYSFESYDKAHMMLRNACESLRPGGYFIGTTIDADQLVHRLRTTGTSSENGSLSFGNQLMTVTLDPSLDVNNLPLFGARYNFRLHGVVDLPEYLVYFPLFTKMLEDFQMELIFRQNFYDFFEEHRYNSDDSELMFRMEAFDKIKGTMSKEQWEAVGLYLVYVFKKKPLR